MELRHFFKNVGLVALVLGSATDLCAKSTREQRDLIVLADMSDGVAEEYRWLYKFMEAASLSLTIENIGPSYRQVHYFAKQATLANYMGKLEELGGIAQVQAIDTFVLLHGGPATLYFSDHAYNLSYLSNLVTGNRRIVPAKMHALYSTACYAASHIPHFLKMGFKSASGALAVNANGAFEYPVFVQYWPAGEAFGAALSKANHLPGILISDRYAKKMGHTDVNSRKQISGNLGLTIND